MTQKREVELIERIYSAIELPTQQWIETIRDTAERTFSDQLVSAQAYEVEVTSHGEYRLGPLAADEPHRSALIAMHGIAARETIKRLYLRGPVASILDTIRPRPSEALMSWLTRTGVGDVVGSIGLDPGGQGAILSWTRRPKQSLSRTLHPSLQRIAAHLGSASRLRRKNTLAEAVIDPQRGVIHAEGVARGSENRLALRDAAIRIDRARCTTSDLDPAQLWTALVQGRWSLVEQFESDGRRYFVARSNPPTRFSALSLTDLERKVIALAALSHPLRVIAYDLGIGLSTASDILQRGLRKLGVSNRAALIQLHGALASPESNATLEESNATLEESNASFDRTTDEGDKSRVCSKQNRDEALTETTGEDAHSNR